MSRAAGSSYEHSGPGWDLGEVAPPGSEPDPLLEEAETLAVKNMEYLAWRADMENLPEPEPGPKYRPADWGDMTGKLICKACLRPIREHELGEWHLR